MRKLEIDEAEADRNHYRLIEKSEDLDALGIPGSYRRENSNDYRLRDFYQAEPSQSDTNY